MKAPDGLAAIRSVFWNPERVPGVNCGVCTTPVTAPYSDCFVCNGHAQTGLALANVVAPLSYAIKGSQAMRDLYTYKDSSIARAQSEPARDRLFNMLYESLSRHLVCFQLLGGAELMVATVPSTSGIRAGRHPLEQMLTMFGEGFGKVHMVYAGPTDLDRNARRTLSPQWYEIQDDADVAGKHVILLDDAWVSGGHTQSTAGALRGAGAKWVSAVILGRVLDPAWDSTKPYLEGKKHRTFDADICPLTGATH